IEGAADTLPTLPVTPATAPPTIARTSPLNQAIDNAAANPPINNPNRTVVVPVGRWLVKGALTLKKGVTLCGATEGPFELFEDPNPIDPTAAAPLAAILLITHDTAPNAPFI